MFLFRLIVIIISLEIINSVCYKPCYGALACGLIRLYILRIYSNGDLCNLLYTLRDVYICEIGCYIVYTRLLYFICDFSHYTSSLLPHESELAVFE